MKNKYLFFLLLSFITFSASSQVAPLLEVNIQPPLTACDPAQTRPLTASYPVPNATTGYTSLPLDPVFNPTFPTTGGTLLNATADDVWSPVVNLPFSFAFYGGYYDQVIVGSNGLISFDITDAGGYCPWAFTASVPSPALPTNAIFGVYQDTNIAAPPVTNPAVQNVNYYVLDTGPNAAPNRVFVVNFNQLPQFQCNAGVGLQTSQIVIHEVSNIVDIFVFDRTPCPTWNSCSGVIGVQNATGTVGSTPTGVNTGCWTSTNDHYQITPNGVSVPTTIQWYQGGTPVVNGIPTGGTPFGALNENPINALPGAVGSPILYTAVVTYTNPDGTTITVSETIPFVVSDLDVDLPVDVNVCSVLPAPYTVDIDQGADIVDGSSTDNNLSHYTITYYTVEQDALDDTGVNMIANPGAYVTSGPFPQTIYVRVSDDFTTFCASVFQFDIDASTPTGTFSYVGSPWNDNITTPQPPVLSVPFTTGGTWTATTNPVQVPPKVLVIDPVTGDITPSGSDPGIYEVYYDIAPANGCPAYQAGPVLIEIIQTSCIATVTGAPTGPLCIGDVVSITYSAPGAVSGSQTGGSLPPGLSGSFTAGVGFVVSGTVTAAGPGYSYDIELLSGVGDTCFANTIIEVRDAATISLSTPAGSTIQSTCEGSALANPINYNIGGSATNVIVSGLPPGMSYTLTGLLVQITGAPSAGSAAGGPYNYSVTATGPCGNSTPLTGTITVNGPTIISLAPGSGSPDQEPCVGSAITPIIYNYGGSATAISVLSLPAGLITTPVANGIQISGTPSAPVGLYTYTVTASGPCPSASLTGDIEIIALPVINGTPTVCIGNTTNLTSPTAPAVLNPWTSSNPAVATVSNTGTVTGVAAGTATITYTAVTLCQQTIVVTVNPLPTITGILNVCETATTPLATTSTPATANPWTSSDVTVATVDNSGVVTGVAAGTADITFTDINGCTDMATVTVIALPVITGTLTVCIGSITTLASTATPAVPNPWSSSNTAVATINAAGDVNGLTAGTTTITFTNSNGCIETAVVTVVALPTITGTFSACEGATTQLQSVDTPATVNPWISSNTAVATVSNTGLVTGVATGTSTITFTNSNGCVTTQLVTINQLPTIGGTFTVCAGLTTQLTNTLTPAASNAWASSDNLVASVNATGLVTANAAGTTIITFTDSNGCTDTETITVIALPSIGGPLAVCNGSTIQLTGTPAPAAVNPWTSSNPAVASVDALGEVTGNAVGTAIITYTNSNGCIITATVTVSALPVISGTLTVCESAVTTLTTLSTPAAVSPWTSSDITVATVNASGDVTGVAAGTADITFTDINGCTDMATVTVIALPVITGTLTVCVGSITTLASTAPPAVPNPWSSSNTAVATINAAGDVNGLTTGTTTITFTNVNGCIATAVVTVVALPTITGTFSACEGATTQLQSVDAPAAVNPWISSSTAVATVSNTGLVTGVATGTSTITFTNSNGCVITQLVTINALPAINGTFTVCAGLTTQLTNTLTPAASNAWVSSNAAIASVNATGLVTGNAAGTADITFTDSNGCTATETVTVIALPTIGGTLTVCNGLTTQLTGTPTPAAVNPWVSSNPAIASVDATGLVTGNALGSVIITYTNSNGCVITANLTVNPLPTINGTFTVCQSATTALTSTATPAASNPWTSSDLTVATVSALGVVTGVSGGTATITFTDNNGCTDTETVTVIATPTVTGTLTVCVGQNTQLTGSPVPALANAWSSANTAVATVSATGLVTGVTQGTSVITYTNANGCFITQTVTVQPLPTVSGATALATVCEDTPIAPQVYTFGGSATGLAIDPMTPLPAGLSFSTTTNTLSGSPTTAGGPYFFDIITVGGCTPIDRITVSITVNPTATLVLAPGTTSPDQTVCINNPMTPIAFAFGDGATGATVTSGLPTGVTGAVVGGLFRISGTPNTQGSFTYIVTTVGGCPQDDIQGVITVVPSATIALVGGTNNPTVCSGEAMTASQIIQYSVGTSATSATNVVASGLPTGITGQFDPVTGIFTISGTSTQVGGPYPYTVTAVGGCNPPSLSGFITITPSAEITVSSGTNTQNPTLCINDPLATPITFALANGATGATISGILPTGLTFNAATLTISGTPTESGPFTYTVKTVGGCGEDDITGVITVNPLPVITLPQDGFICVDDAGNPLPASSFTLTSGLSSTGHTFIWSDVNGVIAGENGTSYVATAPGVYSVEATNTSTGCSNVGSTTVITSFGPQDVKAIASAYFSEDQVVTVVVTPVGNYEFQLENGAWQDSNQFFNLASGEYTINVRDKVGCGEKSTTIRIIDYPKFFTPNGDGYNDTWNISDLSDQENSTIYIFDRMGKLLKQISPKGAGWDGTFNGQPLPGSDYWFTVTFEEEGISKEFKAHFSIKR